MTVQYYLSLVGFSYGKLDSHRHRDNAQLKSLLDVIRRMIAMKEDPMAILFLFSLMKDKSMMEESAQLLLESDKYDCFGKYFTQLDEICQLRFVRRATR